MQARELAGNGLRNIRKALDGFAAYGRRRQFCEWLHPKIQLLMKDIEAGMKLYELESKYGRRVARGEGVQDGAATESTNQFPPSPQIPQSNPESHPEYPSYAKATSVADNHGAGFVVSGGAVVLNKDTENREPSFSFKADLSEAAVKKLEAGSVATVAVAKPGLVTANWPSEAAIEIEGYAGNPRLLVGRLYDEGGDGKTFRRVSVWKDRGGRVKPGMKRVPCRLDKVNGDPIYSVV